MTQLSVRQRFISSKKECQQEAIWKKEEKNVNLFMAINASPGYPLTPCLVLLLTEVLIAILCNSRLLTTICAVFIVFI